MNRRLIEMIAKVNAEIPIGRGNSQEAEKEKTLLYRFMCMNTSLSLLALMCSMW